MRLRSSKDPQSCEKAIRAAARKESIWIDGGMAETPIFRMHRGNLEVRFKRALVRVIVHNWFRIHLDPDATGGTAISIQERVGLGRGWWFPAIFAALFFGGASAAFGRFSIDDVAGGSAAVQMAGLLFGAKVTSTLVQKDRERISSFLSDAVAADGAA